VERATLTKTEKDITQSLENEMHTQPLIFATRLLKRSVRTVIGFVYNIPSIRWLARRVAQVIPDKIYRAILHFGVPKAIRSESSRAVPESAEWILRALDRRFIGRH
jgi:hypothetical protein